TSVLSPLPRPPLSPLRPYTTLFRSRKILFLIDVSGSMKARTEENMRLAHALVQAAGNVEVFTFGTRLTRVTPALRLKRREQALRSEEHTSELQSRFELVCRLLLEKK